MNNALHFFLEEFGEVEDTSYLYSSPNFGEPCEYGMAISSKLEFLDQRAKELAIPSMSSFIQAKTESSNQPTWCCYSEGLSTIEPLMSDLILQCDKSTAVAGIETLMWDMRICELILRKAELNCEGFYLFYA